MSELHDLINASLVEDDELLTLADLCRACDVHAEVITEMVDYGIIEPCDGSGTRWQFTGSCLWRVTTVVRLQRDLEVNLAGAALALDLLDELRTLRRQLKSAGQAD